MSGPTPVYVAYLSGQLMVAHEAIVTLWKGWKSDPRNLEGAILEAVKCVPDDLRTPDMPQREEERCPSATENDFTKKELNPIHSRRERKRNNDGLI